MTATWGPREQILYLRYSNRTCGAKQKLQTVSIDSCGQRRRPADLCGGRCLVVAGANAVIHAEFEASTEMIQQSLERLQVPAASITAYIEEVRQRRYREASA